MPDLDELKLLIRSWHPLITMETVEEERAERLVRRACTELHLPLFVWTVVEGLRRFLPTPERYSPASAKPAQALDRLAVPFELPLPDEGQIEAAVRRTFSKLSKVHPVKAKLTGADLRAIIGSLCRTPRAGATGPDRRAVQEPAALGDHGRENRCPAGVDRRAVPSRGLIAPWIC